MTIIPQTVSKNDLDTVGKRLRYTREKSGHSRRTLGEEAGMSLRTIEHYENGTTEISLDKLATLAEALSANLGWLTAGSQVSNETSSNIAIVDQPSPQQSDSSVPAATASGLESYKAGLKDTLLNLGEAREQGLAERSRMSIALIEDCQNSARYLELDEIFGIASIMGVQTSPESIERHEVMIDHLNANRGVEGRNLLDRDELVRQEVLDRLIDRALFNVDLYTVDLGSLANIARDWKITTGRFLFDTGWNNHEEIVPAIREKLREAAFQEDELSFSEALEEGELEITNRS
jgi:transcriptional regulator with XRE-family HTH domain